MHKQKQIDTSVEQEFCSFLDDYLYDREVCLEYNRFQDRKNQLLGKDIAAKFNPDKINCSDIESCIIDEKCQTHYINANLPQNGFELSFLDGGGTKREGWLVNEDLETTHYLIIWPWSKDTNREWKKSDLEYFDRSNIQKLDCLLIKKTEIFKFLNKYGGFNRKNLLKKEKEIRNMPINKVDNPIRTKYSFIKFYYSHYLPEKPITISIRKGMLKKIAVSRFMVTRNELEVLSA